MNILIESLEIAFIVAFAGCILLVISKSRKVSDLRQEWIYSFRIALSEFIAAADLIRGRILMRSSHSVSQKLSAEDTEKLAIQLNEYWEKLHKYRALVLLHMKPSAKHASSFPRQNHIDYEETIRLKMQTIVNLLEEEHNIIALQDHSKIEITELLDLSRSFIKIEWGRVEKGGGMYQVALWACWISLPLIALIAFPLLSQYVKAIWA